MMQTLRKYMKHILWVVVVGFIATIIFSWGMGGFQNRVTGAERGIIGIVDGQEIQAQDFLMAVEQEIESTKSQSNLTDLSEYQIQSIRDQIWELTVQNILFSKEVERLNIQVTPQEVVYYMRNYPLESIRADEQFHTDGQFDIAKYQQALNDPRNYEVWIPVENYLQAVLPLQKLQQQVVSTVRVTENEIREAYRLDNEKVNAQYLFFDPSQTSLENIEVSDSEIESYYRSHRDDYGEPEERKIRYVLFENEPSKEDSIETRLDAEDLISRIQNGADFTELAQDYSEDTGSASNGGDLGFFERGTMVKPFEDAAFSAKINDIVGPVESQYGLHIIQVLAQKVENNDTSIHARHILLKYSTSAETYEMINDRAQYFYDEVTGNKGEYFYELAEEEGLTVNETPLFQEGEFVPGIGFSAKINFYAFYEKKDWISPPITSGDNIIIFQISEIQKPSIRPLEEVRSSIQRILEDQKRREKVKEEAQQVWEKINNGVPFDAAGGDTEVRTTGLFSLQSSIVTIGRDPRFSGTAFQLQTGEVSPPIEGIRGVYILKVIEKTSINETLFENEKENLEQTLLQEKQQIAFTTWYNDLKDKAKIEDFRNQYF
ncbi:peptidylprolyl isomerase [bacterium]|nr:peptidylprolyl isomerase [bacterium]